MKRGGWAGVFGVFAALAAWGAASGLRAQTPPSDLTALATGVSGQVDLSWQAPPDSGITGYNLYWGLSGTATPVIGTTSPQASGVTSTAYAAALPPADDGQAYVYWVTTVENPGGESQPSAPAWATSYVAPGSATLEAQLTGYGTVSLTASAAQQTYALAYLSVSAASGGNSAWLADIPASGGGGTLTGVLLGSCGSISLTAQAVDVSGNAGAESSIVPEEAPCGPDISAAALTDTAGEQLSWTSFPGQSDSAYIVAAGSVTSAADPLPQPLTVTGQTSYTYLSTTAANLVYRVYAVDNGVTSAAAAGEFDKAYSFGVPQFQSFNAPYNVTVTAVWDPFVPVGPAANPINYTLWGSTIAAPDSFSVLTTVAASAGSITLPAQEQGYYYFLSVSDGAEASSLTPPVSALLFAPALVTPTVTAPSVSATGVQIFWYPVNYATGYAVFRTDVTGTPVVVSSFQSANSYPYNGSEYSYTDSTSFEPGGAAPSVDSLAYVVQAYASLTVSGADDSALSVPVTAANPSAAPPPVLTAVATGVRGTVALAWTPVTSVATGGLSSYELFYSTQSASPQGAGVTSTSVAVSVTALTVSKFPSGSPLPDGTLAWFWVAGSIGQGPGAYSNAAGVIPYTQPTAPSLTAGVLPFGQGVTVSVALTGTPDVALSTVTVNETLNGVVSPVAGLDPAALSVTLSAGLFPCGVGFTLTAQTADIAGDTGTSSRGQWLLAPCSPTAQATGLSSGALTLDWSVPVGGAGDTYDVYAATSPGWQAGFLPTALTQSVTGLDYTAPASDGQSLWYSVYAVDPYGVTTAASAQVALLAPPTALQAVPGSRLVTLSWTPPVSVGSVAPDSYTIFYSSAPAFVTGTAALGVSPGATALTVAASVTSLDLTGLQDFTPYVFAVASRSGVGAPVSGSASAPVSATTGLAGPQISSVATGPPLGSSVVFRPLTPGAGGPTSTLLVQWGLGSYTPLASSVFTVYEATDAVSSPQTFNTITPVASTAANSVSLTAGAPGPAWYFVNVTDSSGANSDGGNTLDARTVAAAYFAPNLSPTTLTLLAPASDGRVLLAWSPVPFAQNYEIYRATQEMTTVSSSGVTYSALATAATPATFFDLTTVAEPLTYVAQVLTYSDAAPVENAHNSYEVVPWLTLPGGGDTNLYAPASNAVTRTPRIVPQDPGFWQLPGLPGDANGNGSVAGVFGYDVTVVAQASGRVFLDWTPSGDGTYPVSYYTVFRGDSPESLTPLATVSWLTAATTTAQAGSVGAGTMPFYCDPNPPQPQSSLYYGVSATDISGNSSADIVTNTVGTALPWPAPQWVPGLCTGYCSSGVVTLAWSPGTSLQAQASGALFITISAGTFPFQGWEVQRVAAVGASATVLAVGTDLTVTAGQVETTSTGLTLSSKTIFSDGSPVPGNVLYIIQAVDTQGNLGAPLAVSVTVPGPSTRTVPLAVSGLGALPTVVDTGSGAVFGAALNWTPNAAADAVTGYAVFRQDPTNLPLTVTASPPYTDPAGLADIPGSWVTYTVQALNSYGAGPASACLFQTLPPAPGGLSLTADIPSGVSLSPAVGLAWTDVLQLQSGSFGGTGSSLGYSGSYTVLRKVSPGGWTALPGCSGLTATAVCADTAPVPSASYEVESVVTDPGASVTVLSAQPVSLTVAALDLTTVPSAPAAVVASSMASGVSLTWTASASSGTYEYWIYRSSAPLSSSPPYAAFLTRVTGTAFVDTGVLGTAGLSATAQTEPYYAVAAAGPFAVGAAVTASAALSAPSGLSASAGSIGAPAALTATVSLAWEPSLSGALVTGYNVWRAYDGASGLTGDTYLSTVAGTAYTDPLTGAAAGLTDTVLSYTVMPEGLSRSGECSLPVTVTAYDLPTKPVALQVNGLDSAVELSWKPAYTAQGVTGYAVAWNVLAGGGGGVTQVASAPTLWTLDGLVPGQSVTVTVQALNSAGASPASAQVTATASALGPPPAPALFTAQSGLTPSASAGPLGIVLGISGTGATSFVIYRSPAPGAALPAVPSAWVPLRLTDAAGGADSPYYLTTIAGTFDCLTDTAVKASYGYSYAVTAVGPAGLPGAESVPLASNPLTVTAYSIWAAPTLGSAAGNLAVNLNWNAPPLAGAGSYPLAGFKLYRLSSSNITTPVDAGFPLTFSLTQTAYTDKAVVNNPPGGNIAYNYWLTCLDAHGYESLSATTGLIAASAPLAPPTNIIAIPANNSVSLQWVTLLSDSSSLGLYNVYRRLTGTTATYGPPLANLFNVGPTTTSYPSGITLQVESLTDAPGLPTSPPDKITECYAISAVDAAGEGPKSRDLCVTPYNPLNPADFYVGNSMVTDASWSPQESVTANPSNPGQNVINISLTWNEIPYAGNLNTGGYPVAGYNIMRSQNGGATYVLLGEVAEPQSATAGTLGHYTDTNEVASQQTLGVADTYEIVPVDTQNNLGLPYDLKSVNLPTFRNALYVYRNSFDPMTGGNVPVQCGLQQSGPFWVKVFTLNGEYVATLITGVSTGTSAVPYISTQVDWNGLNSRGQTVASGVYLIHMQGPGCIADARVAVIK